MNQQLKEMIPVEAQGVRLHEKRGDANGLGVVLSAVRETAFPPSVIEKPSLQESLRVRITRAERNAAVMVARNRPCALRDYDQIPMHTSDLVRQAKIIAPYLAGQTVAFVGDIDSASLMLGMLARHGNPCPARMLVLDFDERLLRAAERMAAQYGFADLLETYLHNFFEPIPADLVGTCDWFYTNPPYGSHNEGASAQLFIARGIELCGGLANGCAILPHDPNRSWTIHSWSATERFLANSGWRVRDKMDRMHHYLLDDDPTLTSSLILVEGAGNALTHYTGRQVTFDEIPVFYGQSVLPPYPRYIRHDGSFDTNWTRTK